MGAALTYITQLRRLLRDANGSFFPLPDPNAELLSYVNDARQAVASDTGANRVLLPQGSPGTTLIGPTKANPTGVEFYPYSAVTAVNILSVLDIYVSYSGIRYPLDYAAYSTIGRSPARMLIGYVDRPVCYSVFGQGISIAPLPFQNFPTEWDVIPQIPVLIDDTTVETIPTPFQLSVRHYAAFMAWLGLQQTARAKEQFGIYMGLTQFCSVRQYQRRLAHGNASWVMG
jgi:hypothetical protein